MIIAVCIQRLEIPLMTPPLIRLLSGREEVLYPLQALKLRVLLDACPIQATKM